MGHKRHFCFVSATPLHLPTCPSTCSPPALPSSQVVTARWFEDLMLLLIVLSSIQLCFDSPGLDPESKMAQVGAAEESSVRMCVWV